VTPSTPGLTVGVSSPTDDDDTDFQSAYSESPRNSHGSLNGIQNIGADETLRGVRIASKGFSYNDFDNSQQSTSKRARVLTTSTTATIRPSAKYD
jgi:EEF1A N-terminal glycine/lysine methyltransferase